MHLKQPIFTYGAYVPFAEKKERKKKKTLRKRTFEILLLNELCKNCFQQDMAYGGFKDSPRRTTSDKLLHNGSFQIDNNRKNDECQRGYA